MTEMWFDVPPDSQFGVANLPFGVYSRTEDGRRKVGVAVGDSVLDVAAIAAVAGDDFAPLLDAESLNPLLAAGMPTWRAVRERITTWLTDPDNRPVVLAHRLDRHGVYLHLPFQVGDYVDFYASEYHARNVGRIFRPDSTALPPNWKWLPIGYHGRAGTIVVSGQPVVRPCGQRKQTGENMPSFGPTRKLDIEAEIGFVVGMPSALGEPVPIERFADHVFGACLVNDWSARDIQALEYMPLGPFLGKSFATSLSPWVVPLDALRHARVPSPPQDPEPQPYLAPDADWGFDITMEVRLNGHVIARPPFGTMYWSPAQQLAHMAINGASLRTGDLYASGTVSGPEPDEYGSLLELTWDATEPLLLGDGTHRTYLNDGDVVTISASAPGPGGSRIGFGDVTGRVLPSVR